MSRRRDAKQVPFVASDGMTEDEYQAAIETNRTFGQIQVHQQFRKLATDLGLPRDCSMVPSIRRRLPRWYVEPEAFRAERQEAETREARIRLRYLFSQPAVVQHPFSWDPQYLVTVA